jgi:hypothetical protein
VPKSAAGKMVIGNFNDDSWIDRFPFAGAVCAPTARSSRRNRPRAFRREWGVRSASGCLEHDLGCQSKTESRHLGISANPVSLICDGRRHLISAASLAGDRSPANGIQPLRAIGVAGWNRDRADRLSHL